MDGGLSRVAPSTCYGQDLRGATWKRLFACGSMVLRIVSVVRFLRSTSAKIELQKKLTYRSAEGWIADRVSPVMEARLRNIRKRQ